jgi:hypothetical protein
LRQLAPRIKLQVATIENKSQKKIALACPRRAHQNRSLFSSTVHGMMPRPGKTATSGTLMLRMSLCSAVSLGVAKQAQTCVAGSFIYRLGV